MEINWANKTGIPFYDDMIKNPLYFIKAKGLTYKIEYMRPLQYFSETAKLHSKHLGEAITPGDEMYMVTITEANKLARKMIEGKSMDMLLLDYVYLTQDGRHRAYAVYQINQRTGESNKVKVMVVTHA